MADIITPEELAGFSTDVLDMLAKYYKYIDKFKDSVKQISFTHHGCMVAFNGIGNSIHGDKFINKFLDNLDVIKKIADEQPVYVFTHKFYKTDADGNPYTYVEEEEFETYGEPDEKAYYCRLKYRNYSPTYYKGSYKLK